MKRIYKFKSISEATSHIGAVSPNVSYVVGSTNKVVYANFGNNKKIMFANNNGVVTAENLATPLNFTAVTANSSVTLNIKGTLTGAQVEYSTDNETWSIYTIGDLITLTNINDKVYFRGDNANISGRNTSNYFYFSMTGYINGSGNTMSLLDTTLTLETVPDYGFYLLFYGCTSLLTPPWLPATSVGAYSYYGMFWNCYYLMTAPELPATTLADHCYTKIFLLCRSLMTAPAILPATTLAGGCYQDMFSGCTSLTTTPELPATTLAYLCYGLMFYGCKSLTTAPALPATTLASLCYYRMFSRCTFLTSLTVYSNDISASNCITEWLTNTAQGTTGTLYALGSADFTGSVPDNWTIVHN